MRSNYSEKARMGSCEPQTTSRGIPMFVRTFSCFVCHCKVWKVKEKETTRTGIRPWKRKWCSTLKNCLFWQSSNTCKVKWNMFSKIKSNQISWRPWQCRNQIILAETTSMSPCKNAVMCSYQRERGAWSENDAQGTCMNKSMKHEPCEHIIRTYVQIGVGVYVVRSSAA